MTCPPSADYIHNLEGIIPDELDQFLKIVISGRESESVKVNRLVLSIGQDICRAATNGHWTLPKHILLCMTLRHMSVTKNF